MTGNHECIIGIWNDYDDTGPVTLNGLKENVSHNNAFYEQHMTEYGHDIGIKYIVLSNYFDKRKRINLNRFRYCPECGKEINWKQLK